MSFTFCVGFERKVLSVSSLYTMRRGGEEIFQSQRTANLSQIRFRLWLIGNVTPCNTRTHVEY